MSSRSEAWRGISTDGRSILSSLLQRRSKTLRTGRKLLSFARNVSPFIFWDHKPRSFSHNVSRFLLTKFLALFRKFLSNCIFISFLFLTIWNGLSDIRARALFPFIFLLFTVLVLIIKLTWNYFFLNNAFIYRIELVHLARMYMGSKIHIQQMSWWDSSMRVYLRKKHV